MGGKHVGWDVAYAEGSPAWVIGHTQPAIVELAAEGLLTGRVLDVGCGTGEHAMLAADYGADALGVDLSPVAIAQAVEIARTRGNSARFAVGDSLELGGLGEMFDVAIDSGHFHVFETATDRLAYAEGLAGVVRRDGTVFITCICDEQVGGWGPHRVTERELRESFRDAWVIEDLRTCRREVNRPEVETWTAEAWLATIRRCGDASTGALAS